MSVAELKERHVAATATVNALRERLQQRRQLLLDTDVATYARNHGKTAISFSPTDLVCCRTLQGHTGKTQDTFMAILAPMRPFMMAPIPRRIKRRKFRGSRHSSLYSDGINYGPHDGQDTAKSTRASRGSPASSADEDRDLGLQDPGPRKNTRSSGTFPAEYIPAASTSATSSASLITELHQLYRHHQSGETSNPRAARSKAAHATFATHAAGGRDNSLTDAFSLLTKTICNPRRGQIRHFRRKGQIR